MLLAIKWKEIIYLLLIIEIKKSLKKEYYIWHAKRSIKKGTDII